MCRKVFLSFLGNNIYKETNYIADGQKEENVRPTRFVQEATIRNFCQDYGKEDEIIIFTTKGALNNWQEEEHWNKKEEKYESYEPLKSRLDALDLKCEIRNENIKYGEKPEELWNIFTTVYNLLEAKDEITFDITHGFRTLPMFNMVLMNYAKLLKNIFVKGIYYGAFEAKYKGESGQVFSPIWDLKEFAELQEWTNNTNIFLKSGIAMPLASLIEDEYSEIKIGLGDFSKYILVNRGADITKGETMLKLKQALHNFEQIKQNSPLNHIISKIKNEFDNYEKDSPVNGFLAARWAIKNGLIQQAATLLEEAVTSFVLFEINQNQYINDSSKRTKTSAAITIGGNRNFLYTNPDDLNPTDLNYDAKYQAAVENLEWEKEFVPIIRKLPIKTKLGGIVASIKESIRNDINHAGFREEPRDYDGLKKSTKKRYKELSKLFKKFNKMELPPLND